MLSSRSFKAPLLILLAGASLAVAATPSSNSRVIVPPPELAHLELEMTGADYRALLDRMQSQSPSVLDQATQSALKPILDLGKRNLDWLKQINAARPASRRLSFTSAKTTIGYPITQVRESNPAIVQQQLEDVRVTMPAELRAVLFDGSPLIAEVPVRDDVYVEWGAKLDRVYQSASRWLLQEPYLAFYANKKKDDVRGYYFLTREADLRAKLEGWRNLDSAMQAKYREWLVGMCVNGLGLFGSESDCARKLDALLVGSARNANAWPYYERHLAAAKAKWDGYFRLENPRSDSIWTAKDPQTFLQPFRDPGDAEIRDWLRENIEDEWKQGGWALRLDFRANARPYVTFVAGATPNVAGLGGDRITMDANKPISEYEVRWTIRHEFGHVLGFIDCYVEFYDSARGVMVNYQLDTTNLMCSRLGHLQPQHVETLRDSYFKSRQSRRF